MSPNQEAGMNNRERLLAILEGRAPDRIPWIPRLNLWYQGQIRRGTMPERYQGLSLREVEHKLGMGTPARRARVFKKEYRQMEVNVIEEGLKETTEYITPKGKVRMVRTGSELLVRQGIDEKIIVEHPLKDDEDYAVWMYVVEHTEFVPTYDQYREFDAEIGADGLPMVLAGDCPFHGWLSELAGYEGGYFHLWDKEALVKDLLDLMTAKDKEMWQIVAESPGQLILHGLHISSTFTPPDYFDPYIAPYYQEFSQLLHENGKFLTMHADNETGVILPNLRAAGYDMLECLATAPLVDVTLEQARETLEHDVIIWGGVPSVILEAAYPEEEFERYMVNLFETIAPGDAFILGISDNAMPDTMISRVEKISEMVAKWGCYPIATHPS